MVKYAESPQLTEEAISRSEVRTIIENAEYCGGKWSPDGDCFQYRVDDDCPTICIFTQKTWGEDVPTDEEILDSAIGINCIGLRILPIVADGDPSAESVSIALDGDLGRLTLIEGRWTVVINHDGIDYAQTVWSEGIQAVCDHLYAIYNCELDGWGDYRGKPIELNNMVKPGRQ